MIKNTNDGTQNPPYLRVDLSMGTLAFLPEWSAGPKNYDRAAYEAIKAAGFGGVQDADREHCAAVGLPRTGGGRVDKIGNAERIAREGKENGLGCVTLHVGTGFESDAEMLGLAADIIAASEKIDFPLYIETHRATMTQDIWRTVQMAKHFPEVRFNGDFSHWYTGHEMVYGDFEKKLDFMAPVLERVRFIHGRIGSPGCMQVDIGDGKDRTYVDHFKEIWTRSFAGFLKDAAPGDYISFAPELLFSSIYYARVFPNAQGEMVEEGDRWQQALLYGEIARECFDAAKARL
jgi:hypothetical protein